LVKDSSKSSKANAAVSAPAANARSEASKCTGGIHRIPVNAPAIRAPEVTSANNTAWLTASPIPLPRCDSKSYEVDNIDPLVFSSPPFAPLRARMSRQKPARLIGVTEILLGSLIAAKPLAPRASAVASLGAAGMFVTTLSFLITTPGVAQPVPVTKAENY